MDELSRNPDTWLSQIQGAQKKQMAVAAQLGKDGQPVVSPKKSDRRFFRRKMAQ